MGDACNNKTSRAVVQTIRQFPVSGETLLLLVAVTPLSSNGDDAP
jgi:hypothetical protein